MILKNGVNASKPLVFLDYGKRLARVFKQLFDEQIIVGCQKKVLENWIEQNFHYRSGNRILKFTPRYLSDIISSNKYIVKNPIRLQFLQSD